jgi:hypothetical protein
MPNRIHTIIGLTVAYLADMVWFAPIDPTGICIAFAFHATLYIIFPVRLTITLSELSITFGNQARRFAYYKIGRCKQP